jgi:hypothetical protein
MKFKCFKNFSYKLKTYFLFLFLLNIISIFSGFLIFSGSDYSLRGDIVIWILTGYINGISSIIFCLLMIVGAFKKHSNKSYNRAFLLSLLGYPVAFFLYILVFFYTNVLVCETTTYVSPSGQKSISIFISTFEGQDSGSLRIKEFIFNKETETIINLPTDWSEPYRKNTSPLKERKRNSQLCDNYKGKTEIKWLNNENQIQIKTKSNKDSQIQIINLE